MAGFVLFAKVG